jgi:NAD(P)-dependent dehydrogenase (short-subunit alcohol dehydrogenase family)
MPQKCESAAPLPSGVSVDGRVASGDPAADVCAEIRDFGGRALACRESVSDFGGARRIVERTVAKFGRLDILVNNAGNLRNASLLEMREEDFDTVVGNRAMQNYGAAKAGVMAMTFV